MPTPAKLEHALSPAEVSQFCARLAATPGGTALRVIIAEARKHGVILNTHSAATVRDGPLAAALAGLHTASAQAASVDEVARDGRDLAGAAAALLVQRLFAKLQGGTELTPRELEQFSRVLGRLQSGINRNRKLEFELQALRDRLAHRESELEFDREKFGRQARHGFVEAIDRLRAKCTANNDELVKLDEVLSYVLRVKPNDPDLAPLKDVVESRARSRVKYEWTPAVILATRRQLAAAERALSDEDRRRYPEFAVPAPGSPPSAPG